ncbi:hypothetical protein ANO11243_090250 [Dothideomycetidae sp. 11243]|nr:hypothetical protein ANO11243_090250 [fungal sp. No.11243]
MTTAKGGPQTTSAARPTASVNPASAEYIVAPIPSGLSNYSKDAYAESAHFRIWGEKNANTTIGLTHLEGTWDCFVNRLGWRSSGLSEFDTANKGPYYKTNVFVYPGLIGATGITAEDIATGLGFIAVLPDWVNYVGVMSHEYGHVMTIAETSWWNGVNTAGWRETIAQFVSETYNNSPFCAASRTAANDTNTGGTLFQPSALLSNSWNTLIDATNSETSLGNQYFAWPFLEYLTYNLDNYSGFGQNFMLNMFNNYSASANETPFHTINRMAGNAKTTVQEIVGRYWARMAYVDYGSYIAQNYFQYLKPTIDYNNTLPTGAANTYKVIPARAPKYMGSSIIPLNNLGSSVTARVSAATAFTATLAVMGASGTVRYIELTPTTGTGVVKTVTEAIASGEQATLVVANTPTTLLMYDASQVSTGPVSVGLDFTFVLTGATTGRGNKSWLRLCPSSSTSSREIFSLPQSLQRQ